MFWRSVVGKLWFTFLLVIFSLLAIIIMLFMEFFDNYYLRGAEEGLLDTSYQIALLLNDYPDQAWIEDVAGRMKEDSSYVIIFKNGEIDWISSSNDGSLPLLTPDWFLANSDGITNDQVTRVDLDADSDQQILLARTHFDDGDGIVYAYQSSHVVAEAIGETTHIILIVGAIAVVIMTIFAYFLSARITAPLIKMRESALELARGEFKTKVPIVTHDEIGELAMAFNRMGRQLNYHINTLKQEKELLYSIVNSMADGVLTINRDGAVILSNAQGEKFLQDCRFELNINDNQQLPSEIEQFVQATIDTKQEEFRELIVQGRTWVIIMSPLYDQVKVRGVVAVIRDMTEERKLDQIREAFIANVSHELRTPIALLQGYSEAIIDDVASSKQEQTELAEIIHAESLRMGRLVNDLLDLARMKAGQLELNVSSEDLDVFLARPIHNFKQLAKKKQVMFTSQVKGALPKIPIDQDRIEQVLINLIDNAIRHTEPHGKITLLVDRVDDHIRFIIKDNGTGIPQEDLPFIFDRFYKADKSRTRTGTSKNGTGLGLAITKQIIEAHDGKIDVQSKETEGTTFVFFLPIKIK